MESNNLYSKNTLYNKTDILTWNISDPLIIKEDNINNINNNNILLESSYNEIIDKNINTIDILKSFDNEEQKNITNSFIKSERDTLSNSNKIFLNDLNETHNKDLKKQLKLKRNRESAKDARIRKKLYIQNLILENKYLKNKYNNLLNIIHKCPK